VERLAPATAPGGADDDRFAAMLAPGNARRPATVNMMAAVRCVFMGRLLV
jgi:hypothetical protein